MEFSLLNDEPVAASGWPRPGGRVRVAADRDRAEQVLDATRTDLLISDVRRGPGRTAGLTDPANWRESGRYAGPAVFFTGRATPHREALAAVLDAKAATSGALLFRYAEEAYEQAAAQAGNGSLSLFPSPLTMHMTNRWPEDLRSAEGDRMTSGRPKSQEGTPT